MIVPGDASDFHAAEIIRETAHRLWPMPSSPWVMTQSWHDLLFMHWPIDPEVMRAHVPAALPLDLYDGRAWIAVVPFAMSNVAPRGIPLPSAVSAFPELNVRTYVTVDGKPGVYFFSLDAENRLAVMGARTVFGLPYHFARMSIERRGESFHYESHRRSSTSPAEFVADYRPTGPIQLPASGTFEYFLTERYCLYTADRRGRAHRLEIHHPPWPLQVAEASVSVNTMASAAGISLPATAPVLHYAKRQDVVAWPMSRA
jgi:uncharacterized protein YqjF (DUF2071 family)